MAAPAVAPACVREAIAHAEPVMGSVVSFSVVPGSRSVAEVRAAIADACARLHDIDSIFSTWNPDSLMSRVRRGEVDVLFAHPALQSPPLAPAVSGTGPLSEIRRVLALCAHAVELSEGWFDPWAMPGGLDPTGLVKGWAAEQALAILAEAGVPAALVNAGGDIALLGRPAGPASSWQIGIRHPWRPEALACVLVSDAAVATSGCYERGRHLVNPRPATRVAPVASATVTGPSLALADALATALAVGGDRVLELIVEIDDYEAYLIGADGSEVATAGIRFSRDELGGVRSGAGDVLCT